MRRRGLLSVLPALTLTLFLAPVIAGLIGTWLPAFGYLPALGGDSFTLAPWAMLAAQPGLGESLRLTLLSGFLATFLAFALTVGFLAACHGGRLVRAVRGLMAPLIALPHAAVALGLAFLIAPSGWLVRLVSPWATGWQLPPDIATVQDPNALALTLGLVVKEMPFLLLMTLAALEQVRADERLAVARSLGYGPVTAWLKAVLPAVYRQIRLPLYAVLAYALSVVDVALILAPLTPPPLAVQVLRWFNDPDLSMRFVAAAGACLQLLVVVAGIGLWRLGEILAERLGRAWIAGGSRGGNGRLARPLAAGLVQGLVALAAASLLALALWSVTERWRFPDALPASLGLETWARQAPHAASVAGTTLATGLLAAAIALLLVLGCLENEQRRGLTLSNRALWLLYVPLLVPQVAFLFGTQVLAIQTGIDATWLALVWSHLLFVLPYVFLTLGDSYRALDERYARTALCLGAHPNRVFWQVKLPMLLRPVLFALAVGFAVSVAQYLPTLFAGGGRFVTLTTEAVGLAAGGDRRVIGVYAFLQALLPLIAFAAALAVPKPLALARKLTVQPA
ncbi:ABC transporter permease subunit [Pelagibius sp. 7325]|uniref:ABC transporter permease n=1 Tax=Pelagibius sp. 7325 TaxID=3131994 RepID=UPI0030ED0CC3